MPSEKKTGFYGDIAKKTEQLVREKAATFGLETAAPAVRIQRMTKKWASCSSKGRVGFSADLLQEPRTFQDVVIVHELLHLQAPNHGKLFKSLMNAYLPGWEMIMEERNGDAKRNL